MSIDHQSQAEPFNPLTGVLIAAIGIVAFVAMLLIGALVPAQHGRNSGRENAASVSAVGFSGLVQLAEAAGLRPELIRSERLLGTSDLVMITPEHGSVPIGDALNRRAGQRTLVVLPKWAIVADPHHAGWVMHQGLLPAYDPEGVLAPGQKLKLRRYRSGGAALVSAPELPAAVRFHAPRPIQVIASADLGKDEDGKPIVMVPLITDERGGIVLGEVSSSEIVLADPDLFSNLGLADPHQAQAAVALLAWLAGDRPVRFDVTLNGLGNGRNLLALAFVPPFLPMTLALALAALLALLHGLGRFGPVRPPERAVAFGKRALVDNAAALVRKARREGPLGARYVQVARERAQRAFGVPPRLRDEALDAYLDKLGGSRPFSALAADMAAANDRHSVLEAARALHGWQEEVKA